MAVSVDPVRVHAGAQLGRTTGAELFTQVNFVAGQQTNINRNMSLQRPLEEILLRFKGRVVIGTANYTAVAAEAPQSILNRIRIFGTWRNGQQVPLDISGATLFAAGRMYDPFGNSLFIGNAPPTRQADPSIPFGQVGTTFGNTGTYDLDIFYRIPMAPFLPHAARAAASYPFWWLPEDWNDSLQIVINFGDNTSFGTPAGGTTVAFTAFGSGAGSPTVDVILVYAQLSKVRGSYHSAIVMRNEQQIVGGVVGAAGNNIQLIPLSKQKITNITVKTGQVLTGTSGAAFVYASLTDTLLDQTQVIADKTTIRNTYSNQSSKEEQARRWSSIQPQGYLNFSFIDGANPRACFRADNPAVVGPGATFALFTSVVTPGANPACSIIQEQIYSQQGDPFWEVHKR